MRLVENRYLFNDKIVNHFGCTIHEFEGQWCKYVGLDDEYREIMN